VVLLTIAYLCLAAVIIGVGYLYPVPQSGALGAVLSLAPYILAGGLVPLIVVSTSARVLIMTAVVIGAFYWLPQEPFNPAQLSAMSSGLLTGSVVTPLLIAGCCFISRRGWLTSRDMVVVAVTTALATGCVWDIQREASFIGSLDARLLAPAFYDSFVFLPPLGYGLYALALGAVSVRGSMTRHTKEFALHAAFLIVSLAALSLLPLINTLLTVACSLLLILVLHTVSQVYGMAFIDELTGLPSRKALNDRLRTLGRRYAICMLDVDHFSQVNNKHGHDTGDDVLKTIAKHISGVTEGGKAYRYGGEEFAIVFPNREADVAADAIDDIRKAVAKYRFTLRKGPREKADTRGIGDRGTATKRKALKVTFSAGIAVRASGEKPEEVMKRADELLYQAKEDGRNRVYYEAEESEV
jgi:diguanylate cyclase (GGDEF)-like protein